MSIFAAVALVVAFSTPTNHAGVRDSVRRCINSGFNCRIGCGASFPDQDDDSTEAREICWEECDEAEIDCVIGAVLGGQLNITPFEVSIFRSTGKPETVVFQVNASTQSSGYLTLFNGVPDEKGTRVSSATVSINGISVFGQSDFNINMAELSAEVPINAGENTLDVQLNSQPGSSITIVITAPANLGKFIFI